MATTLSAGGVAIIGVSTEDTIPGGSVANDSISFILLEPIETGTTIYFTDRDWNGTAFVAAAGEGTFTFTAGSNMAAGSVIHVSQADLTSAGMSLSSAGETIYAYQGTSADAPSLFLHAVDIADGNTGFEGTELTGTGLADGTSAVAINDDNAEFGVPTSPVNTPDLFAAVNTNTAWVHNDNSPQDGTATGAPAFTAPDAQIWVAGSGAGEGIVTINLDGTYNSGTLGYQIVQAFQNDANLFHPSDITLDTVSDKYFFVDSDISGGHNRIIQGSISELLNNPGGAPTFTVLYSDTGTTAASSMRTLSVDTVNNIIYFDHGTTFNKIVYDTALQTPTVLADLTTFGTNNFITQVSIDYATGQVLLGSSRVTTFGSFDSVSKNYVYSATGLTSGSSTLTFSRMNFNPDDNDAGGPNNANIPGLSGEAFPAELGTIRGIDIDTVNHVAYIATGTVILDVSAAQDGSQLQTFYGGIYSYALTGNPNGDFVTLYQQTGSPGAPSGSGPNGLLRYVEVDPATGRYYVVDETGVNSDPGDGGVWSGSLTTPGTPTFLATVGNFNGLGPQGLEIQHAPTLSGSTQSATYAETGGNPSPNGTPVIVASNFQSDDADSGGASDGQELAGAQVRISANFQSGSGHQDQLTINGTTSGTVGAITFSYDASTGIMTLTGIATLDAYEAALALVAIRVDGDNPTDYGTATSRTLSYATFDGLLYSDEQDFTVTIAAVNDNPENVTGGVSATGNEDATFAITGLSISDVDADPASQTMTVTLSVAHGTLTLRTDVSNGLAAGDVSGNGTTSVTLTGTLNEINTTLADATGLQYHGDLNFNTGFAAENLHIVTTDGGNTGSGGTLGDTDDVAITVNAVNDNPDVQPDTFSAVAYTENASTTALFAGANIDTPLSDVDQVTNYLGGSIDLDITGGLVSGDRLQLTGTRFAINAGSVQDTANGNAVVGTIGVTNGTSHVTISSLTAAATPSVVSALLKAFGFDSTSDDPGAGARTVTLTFNDGGNTGSGGTKTDAVTQTVNVTPVNDAPTLTATAVNPTFTEAPGAGTQALAVGLFTGAAASTIEAGQTVTSFTLTVSGLLDGAKEKIGAGGLAISLGADSSGSTAGLSYVSTIVAGVATIVITATAPITAGNFTTLINNITYQNTNTDNPTAGDRIVTLTSVTDSGGDDDTTSLAIASTVHVASVNDGPDATITTDPYSATEQTPLVLKGTGLTITDADAGSGILTVTLSVTQGELTVTAGDSGVNVVSGNATTSVVVSGTLAQLTALLAAGGTSNLVYVSTTDLYLSAGETLTLSVDDGGNSGGSALSDADTATINVTSTNDAPVATIVPTTIAGDPSVALSLKNKGLSVFDADSGAHVITVTLAVDHGTLTVTPGFTGVGIVGSGTGLVTLTGKYDDINAVLNTDPLSTVEFTGTDPVNTLTLTIDDGGFSGTGGAFSDSDTVQILLDKPPVVSGAGSTVGYTEQTTAIALETSLGLSDQDSATLNGATVVISAPVAGDVLAAVTTGTSIAANYAAGTLTLNGSDTIANYLTVLSTVTFASSSEDPASGGSAPSRTITWTVRDDFDVASAPVTTTVNVTGVNDAPVTVITPASYSATEQTSLNLKGTGLAVGDLDAGAAATVTATLSVGSGKLLASAGTSGAIVANSGTSSVSITGTLAQINALLMTDCTSTLSYINELDGPPASTTLTLAVNDGGNTGNGGALIGSDTASIAIAGIDDAPTGLDLDNEVTTLSEAASTKSARKVADIVLHDPDGNTALSLSGADAFLFKIVGDDLVLKAGAKIDFETNPLLDVTVNADGAGAHFASSMTISLTDAQERIRGSNASEHISGTGQAESINGRGGDDTIKARNGDDTIRGGAGADVVTGGRGEDVFVFKPGDLPKIGTFDQTFGLFFGKYDVITDFKPGTDTIDLSAIDANTHRHGNQAFHFEGRDSLSHSRGELVYRFGEDGDGDRATVILGDANGDGRADFRIVLKGHHTLHADDFIL